MLGSRRFGLGAATIALVLAVLAVGGSAAAASATSISTTSISTSQFVNQFDSEPYVGNGYFSQRIPAAGAGLLTGLGRRPPRAAAPEIDDRRCRAGGMFEGLMANLVVPETRWGRQSFGLSDLRWTQVQIRYATSQLHYPVWGMSPSSTPDDTGGYATYGAMGLAFGPGQQLAQCPTCATEKAVSPHASAIALPVLPRTALANLETLRARYPDAYSADGGFYDAVDPTTGSVGHRRLVLDQSMIMAAIDDALDGGALQRYFAADRVSWAARAVLGAERMSIS